MGDYAKKKMMAEGYRKKKSAKQAINADDARGFRKRKVNAKRISAGKPKVSATGAAKKQDDKAGDMNKFISGMKKKKPF